MGHETVIAGYRMELTKALKQRDELREALHRWATDVDDEDGHVPDFVHLALANLNKTDGE